MPSEVRRTTGRRRRCWRKALCIRVRCPWNDLQFLTSKLIVSKKAQKQVISFNITFRFGSLLVLRSARYFAVLHNYYEKHYFSVSLASHPFPLTHLLIFLGRKSNWKPVREKRQKTASERFFILLLTINTKKLAFLWKLRKDP